ncbi:glycogen-binding subunit 76A-like protein, partial [Dinothrombium tinctorium]
YGRCNSIKSNNTENQIELVEIAGLSFEFKSENNENDIKVKRRQSTPEININKSSENKSEEYRRRKSVTFADSVGLKLESVRLIPKNRVKISRPTYPCLKEAEETKSLQKQLRQLWSSFNSWTTREDLESKAILDIVEYSSPEALIDKIQNQKVCLKNCFIEVEGATIKVKCKILVVNIDLSKRITVRYTIDNWRSWTDIEAKYVLNSCNGWSDEYNADFNIFIGDSNGELVCEQTILFAVCYEVDGNEYWDNNLGSNYSFTFQERQL